MHVFPAFYCYYRHILSHGTVVRGEIEHIKIFGKHPLAFKLVTHFIYIYVPAAADKQHGFAPQFFAVIMLSPLR